MKKKLDIQGVTNELRGGSAFFPSYAKKEIELEKDPTPLSAGVPAQATEGDVEMSTKPQTRLSTKSSAPTSLDERPEKYTTHLEPSLIKRLKLFAVEKDLKDYQVIK